MEQVNDRAQFGGAAGIVPTAAMRPIVDGPHRPARGRWRPLLEYRLQPADVSEHCRAGSPSPPKGGTPTAPTDTRPLESTRRHGDAPRRPHAADMECDNAAHGDFVLNWADRVERTPGDPLRDCWSKPGMLVRAVRTLAAVVVRVFLRVYGRFTIVGRQNLPSDRSFILVANHASHLDTLCLLSALPIRQLHLAFPVAASEYFCVNRLLALLAKLFVNVLPFDRQFACWESLRVCAQMLQEQPGTVLILFPEGTRTGGIEPGKFKPGVGLLASGRPIPVVPCHLAGTHAALPKGAWFPRPRRIRLTIGVPRVYADMPATKESSRQICRELRESVMSLAHMSREVP